MALLALAQDNSTPAPQEASSQVTSAPAASASAKKPESSPTWQSLNANQKTALAPLHKLWPEISEAQKRKWLALSVNFSDRSAEEQAKMQARMKDWAKLTPQQRALARLNFAEVQQVTVDERKSKWEAYQSLSRDERHELTKGHPPAPNSAAIATRPVPSQKLAVLPVPKTSQPTQLRIDMDLVHPVTLLPLNARGHASP
ncbi:MAG: DUF3106 domain-containing protein [Limnohabitans sp.]|jgi:hypothetical protein|nr:DUF3106 domain-containing protein [Limnohabitans sp.]